MPVLTKRRRGGLPAPPSSLGESSGKPPRSSVARATGSPRDERSRPRSPAGDTRRIEQKHQVVEARLRVPVHQAGQSFASPPGAFQQISTSEPAGLDTGEYQADRRVLNLSRPASSSLDWVCGKRRPYPASAVAAEPAGVGRISPGNGRNSRTLCSCISTRRRSRGESCPRRPGRELSIAREALTSGRIQARRQLGASEGDSRVRQHPSGGRQCRRATPGACASTNLRAAHHSRVVGARYCSLHDG